MNISHRKAKRTAIIHPRYNDAMKALSNEPMSRNTIAVRYLLRLRFFQKMNIVVATPTEDNEIFDRQHLAAVRRKLSNKKR